MKIALTGGSGKLGTNVLAYLREAGHDVTNLDRAGERGSGFLRVDLTDFGDVTSALSGVRDGSYQDGPTPYEAVVHLAAIPAPGVVSDEATFHNNALTTFNVFHAATRLGIRNVVFASSETILGLPFITPPPYIPLDEEVELPESVYSLNKLLEEKQAEQLARWYPDLKIVALRFSNVMNVEDYADFPAFDADANLRKWNLWGYIDARDGGQAVLRALEYSTPGFERFVIASPDTVMTRPNAELVAEVFPGVEVRGELGVNDTLLSIEKARRLLGYDPKHTWRDHV
ncbi:NAD-dependent epimerase/dehydratase family protein [Gryllotalpicola protaetiae]|uniref:NAD(P)-dependent oxidoreductase n=1 Tax=Gryllotalpicola protaetiae TaxID=2419771 RepID=A0A387BNK7_9MICO|nr:NAD(P)-dependent oxidoreductase [Gryllotalpicola protaetiae]AYG04022.1 NAD(P)-dependent oxidoreductase [Gryllotalpicola protaetiae]